MSKSEDPFLAEIENDKRVSKQYIERSLSSSNFYEKPMIETYKRSLLLLGGGGVEVHNDDHGTVAAADNQLPVASYIAHGGRVMIEIPPNTGDKLINWLTSGNASQNGRSTELDQLQALSKDKKPVYRRRAATHGVEITKDKSGQYKLDELHGFSVGFKDALSSFVEDDAASKHWGCDLALNVDPDTNTRPDGSVVGFLGNGESGHLYMNYTPPTADKPGALLIGIENASPDSPNHSMLGTPAETSAFGGSKWKKLDAKQSFDSVDIVTPKQFGGMTMKLSKKNLEQIVQTRASDYGSDLGSYIPARSMKEFQENVILGPAHTTPQSYGAQENAVVDKVRSHHNKKQLLVVPTLKASKASSIEL